MRGFRIISACKQSHEDQESDFYIYFNSILHLLNDYYWVIPGSSFVLPLEWYADSEKFPEHPQLKEFYGAHIQETRNYRLCDNNFMQRFAPYVYDDWNEFYCFKDISQAKEILEFLESNDYYDGQKLTAFIKGKMDFYFDNIDGACWEVFAKNEAHLIIIDNILNSLQDISVVECNISELEKRY